MISGLKLFDPVCVHHVRGSSSLLRPSHDGDLGFCRPKDCNPLVRDGVVMAGPFPPSLTWSHIPGRQF